MSSRADGGPYVHMPPDRALVSALQLLPPRHRAVLLLRDVSAFSARDTAWILDTTEAWVDAALPRARAALRLFAPSPRAG
jgi:RNA polymerase sigma-70 factor, ECF subfamily